MFDNYSKLGTPRVLVRDFMSAAIESILQVSDSDAIKFLLF